MQMKTKSCILLLWIQTLTIVKCFECTLDQFVNSGDFDAKFDTTVLDAKYPGGKQVRVPCVTGFTGFFKLICTEDGWKTVGSKCDPKSCGHPGDAQFADFQLVSGDDFVFGSMVSYTCHKGFQMVSRSNVRRCMADGWDGVVPVCEAQRCPFIHVGDEVQVIGDLEEATFGNVIRFSCKTNNQILIGATEIYCNERGEWSDVAPECKEIKCEVPVIEHGNVINAPNEYKENEVLNFVCENDYKRADERFPRCIKVGSKAEWSPTPGCKLKTCDLDLRTATGVTYSPSNKNVFTPGSTLRVTCWRKYWIINTQTTTADVTCNKNGEWSIRPVCKEVTCSDPQDNNVYYWPTSWQPRKLDDTVRYSCRRGFEKPEGITDATCTRDGWTPKPLCQRTWCTKPDTGNAHIIYNDRSAYSNGDYFRYECNRGDETFTLTCEHGTWSGDVTCPDSRPCTKPAIRHGFASDPVGDTSYYTCNDGFKLPTKAWWGVAKCVRGLWQGLRQCIENNVCGDAPKIPKGKTTKSSGRTQMLKISCDEGYRPEISYLTCGSGTWDSAGVPLSDICQSTGDLCGPPEKVVNAIVTTPYQTEYLSDSTVTYQCRDGYVMEGEDTITCRAGQWEKKIMSCVAHCSRLQDEKLTVKLSMVKERYRNGDVVEYVCNAPDANEEGSATCVDGEWNKTVECQGIPCNVGEIQPDLRVTGLPAASDTVKAGAKLQFHCVEPHVLRGPQEVECLETGKWDASFPSCVGNSGCQKPPPLEDGDIKGSSKLQYDNSESVEYMCQRLYKMEGTGRRTCVNGQWTGEIKCLKPCTVNLRDMEARNIRLAYANSNKMYAEHADHITFACETGRRVGPVQFRQECVNGVMDLPTCR